MASSGAAWHQIGTEQGSAFTAPGTLLRAQRREGPEGLDIALFGIPFDQGTVGPDGARYGPAQIRERSLNVLDTHAQTGVRPFELCKVADIGDAPIDMFDCQRSLDRIERYCRGLCAAGALPLAAGGDHLISLPIVRGIATPQAPVGVIHFDAHSDTDDEFWGNRINHATPFRRLVEEGLEDPRRHVMIGIRGTLDAATAEGIEWAHKQGMTVLGIDDCFELGPRAVAERAREAVGEGPVYLTLDVDAIDPSQMPGTGWPEPGGLSVRDVQVILRGLRGLDFVGGDLNELAPPFDRSGLSALNAAHLLFEMLCLLAESRAARD